MTTWFNPHRQKKIITSSFVSTDKIGKKYTGKFRVTLMFEPTLNRKVNVDLTHYALRCALENAEKAIKESLGFYLNFPEIQIELVEPK